MEGEVVPPVVRPVRLNVTVDIYRFLEGEQCVGFGSYSREMDERW